MKILKDAEQVTSGEFWYDLTDGGYIKPEELVIAEDAEKVKYAIEVIQEFKETLEENGLLEEM